MATIPAFQSGLAGFQSGMTSLNNNASKIANHSVDSDQNLTQPIVDLLADEQQVKASAKVIEASDSMIGTLLDIKV